MMQKEQITVRPMEEGDLERVAQLEKENFSMPWSVLSLRDALGNPAAFYVVAQEEDRIVGCCGCWQSLDEGEVMNVSVAGDCRGRGIAFALLQELEKIGEARGVLSYTLEVRESNAPAIRLYHKCGYRSEGIRPNFYENPRENALIMWKRQETQGIFTSVSCV